MSHLCGRLKLPCVQAAGQWDPKDWIAGSLIQEDVELKENH